MRIEVTAEDIEAGERLSACRCPIALAVRRAGLFAPEVYPAGGANESHPPHEGELIYGERRVVVRLPPEASRFASAFDHRKPVASFAFDLDIAAQPAPPTESP